MTDYRTLLLTDDERARFAAYLERTAADDEAMIAQMEKIKAPEVLIKRTRTEALAAKIIAAKLRSIESVSISGAEGASV